MLLKPSLAPALFAFPGPFSSQRGETEEGVFFPGYKYLFEATKCDDDNGEEGEGKGGQEMDKRKVRGKAEGDAREDNLGRGQKRRKREEISLPFWNGKCTYSHPPSSPSPLSAVRPSI